MKQGIWRSSPALVVSVLALFVTLGGTVYAAKSAKLNGKTIRMKSLPGNRLKPRSVPPNRLKLKPLQQALQTGGMPNALTGADINELTLGQVPSATHADTAGYAQSAGDAQTAVNAVNAVTAQKVNGYEAGCRPGTQLFAGACWQNSTSPAAVTAPVAAAECATQGGTLPEALQLAAFAKQPGVHIHGGDEWSSDIVNFIAENALAVITISPAGGIRSGLYNAAGLSDTNHYRCVLPLVR